MTKYRVWTINASNQHPYSIMTEWQSYRKCERFIHTRWGHWPPFAYISSCKDSVTFAKLHDKGR